MQKRLLTEGDVDLAKTIEIALSMEAAHKNAQALKTSTPELSVGKVTRASSRRQYSANPSDSQAQLCYRCGKSGHLARKCTHKDSTYHKCGKKGLSLISESTKNSLFPTAQLSKSSVALLHIPLNPSLC